MTKTFEPRWYQQEAVDAVAKYLGAKPDGRPLVAAPGGAGKSGMCAMTIQRIRARKKTVLYLTMSAKLVQQTFEHVLMLGADLAGECTIACAELGKPSFNGSVVLGTPQTVVRNLDKLGGFDYILVDEAHGIPRDPRSMYGRIFKAIEAPLILWTGTPWRLDSGLLHEGMGAIADEIVYQIPVETLHDEGYLVKFLYRRGPVEIDASKISIQRGEFSQREMEDIAMDMALCEAVAKDIKLQFTDRGRKHCIAFCVSIDHAEMMADHLRRIGMDAHAVSSDDTKDDKRRLLEGFAKGEFEVLCQVGIALTGYDAPLTDMIAWVRATNSAGLFTQGSWRGSRPVFPIGWPRETVDERFAAIEASGKRNCMLRDYGGNLFRHGTIEDIQRDLKTTKVKFRKARECPNIKCEAIVSRLAETCPECGEMIISHARVVQQSNQKTFEQNVRVGVWLDVEDYRSAVQGRPGRRDSFRITFITSGGKPYAMHIFFEYDDRSKSERRWAACGGQKPFPSSAASALNRAPRELRMPRRIMIRQDERSGYIGVDRIEL